MSPRRLASILHVDLDAFYASVEQLADPALRGRPVVVGGLGPRGVVAAASYEARGYGIHSAMPTGRARRRCPDAVFLAPRFDAYTAASRDVMAILRDATPLVEPLSLDEAFLDVSGAQRTQGDGPTIGAAIRQRVKAETGLVASVGVATSKHLAKLASEAAKPDGLLVVEPGSEIDFLHPLDIGRLWGVGPATRAKLERLGVRTVGDIAALDVETLVAALGSAQGSHVHRLACDRDDRPVEPHREVKSVGHEQTFSRDLTDRAQLEQALAGLADRVGQRLRRAERAGRTVHLKVRYPDFRTITRARTLAAPSDVGAVIGDVARALLTELDVAAGVRLLGVSVSKLAARPGEVGALTLDASVAAAPSGRDERRRGRESAVERAADRARARFGDGAVRVGAVPPAPVGAPTREQIGGTGEPVSGEERPLA